MKQILIAYGTHTGTTKEVAEAIQKNLITNEWQVTIMPFKDIMDIDDYDGVVVGAPINGFKWLPEAERFIETFESKLKMIPTAYFMLSYLVMTGRPTIRKKMKSCFNAASLMVKPMATGYFGGKIEQTFPMPVRLLFGVDKNAPLDVRNWTEIEQWAKELKNQLGGVV